MCQFGPRYVALVGFSLKIQEIKGGLRVIDNKIKEAIAGAFALFEVGIENAQLANTLPIRDKGTRFGVLKQGVSGFFGIGVHVWIALFESLNALFARGSEANFIARQAFAPNWGQGSLFALQ